jgi:hypothetical protein
VPPNVEVEFTTNINNKDRLVEPVTFIWEFDDGSFLSRQLTPDEISSGIFTVYHTYTPSLDELPIEFVATLRIFDYDGGLGYDEVVVTVTWADFLKNAITSFGDVSIGSNASVSGPVVYGGQISGEENVEGGDFEHRDTIYWPLNTDFSNFYLNQVTDPDAPDPSDSIDLGDLTSAELGWLYRDGDLVIDNTDPNVTTIDLTDTIYIAGNLEFPQTGASKAYTINLNGQAIFAEGNISFPSHGVTLSGSGCIIALGDINFQPAISTADTPFIVVMSIEGEVSFNPNAVFYGAVLGQSVVTLQPDCNIVNDGEIPQIPDELNFPG